jgi:hypothetical protein
MEKVTKVNLWDHLRMHARRAALGVIAGGVVGCTPHSIPSTAVAELPVAGLSALTLNSGETPLPDARTEGSTLLVDDPIRVIRLANFDLGDAAPRAAAGLSSATRTGCHRSRRGHASLCDSRRTREISTARRLRFLSSSSARRHRARPEGGSAELSAKPTFDFPRVSFADSCENYPNRTLGGQSCGR